MKAPGTNASFHGTFLLARWSQRESVTSKSLRKDRRHLTYRPNPRRGGEPLDQPGIDLST